MTVQDQGGAQGEPHVVTVVYDFQGRALHSCLRCHYAGFSAPTLPCRPAPLTAPAASPADEGQAGEVEVLAEAIQPLIEGDGNTRYYDLAGSGLRPARVIAATVLAAGYVSAAEVERRVAEARAEAWAEGYLRGTLDTTSDLEPADNPYRADSHDTGSERGES